MPSFKRYLSGLFCLLCTTFSLPVTAGGDTHTFMEIFQRHPVVMLLIDPRDGAVFAANKAASRYYGYSQDKLSAMTIQQINALPAQAVADERRLAEAENRNYFIFRHRLANGSERTVEVYSVPVVLSGQPLLFSIVNDISKQRTAEDSLWHYQNRLEEMVDQQIRSLKSKENFILYLMGITSLSLLIAAGTLLFMLIRRRRAADRLQREKQRLDDIIWGTHAGTWEWDLPSGQVEINDRWAEMLGYSKDELSPFSVRRWNEMTHPEDLKAGQERVRQSLNGEQHDYESEIRMRHKAGHWVWLLDRGRVISRDPAGKPLRMCGTRQDITLSKTSALQLEHLALHDQLTGLANRTLLYQQLNHTLENARNYSTRFAVMFIDLDGFKQVNDRYGHHAGDELLTEVAIRLNQSLRHSDLCARMGGDEFAVLLYHIQDPAAAAAVAEHILHKLNLPFYIGAEICLNISCSIGIALYPGHGDSSNTLVQKADDAMYAAKRSGKNRCVFAGDLSAYPAQAGSRSQPAPDEMSD